MVLRPRFLLVPVLLAAATLTLAAADGPRSARASGIDVSHWQGEIDWARVQDDGIAFAFIKATEGGDHTDPRFARNWRAARRAGVPRGAYHFYRPEAPAVVQARHFLRTVDLRVGDLPPVLDVELTGGRSAARVRREVETWLRLVERETGMRPIVYISPQVAEHLDGQLRRHALWVAHYRSTPPPVPADWTRWTFWQYSNSGRVDGIRGPVDLNRFRGSRSRLDSFIRSQGRSYH